MNFPYIPCEQNVDFVHFNLQINSTEELRDLPSAACSGVMENIGSAKLESLPPGPGDMKRGQLANISIDCIVSLMYQDMKIVLKQTK